MARLDSHYTPPDIAEALVDQIQRERNGPLIVADVAAGAGALLDVAVKQFAQPTCLATDVDPKVVRALKAAHPDWHVGRCDFLRPGSVARSILGPRSPMVPDVVLLNPPFSCRGGRVISSVVFGEPVTSSPALAFVLRALEYVASNGEVSALLPLSTFSSEKDERAWQVLRANAKVETGARFGRSNFAQAFAATGLAHFIRKPFESSSGATPAISLSSTANSLVLYRGRLPMYSAWLHGVPLLHTTTVNEGVARIHSRLFGPVSQSVQGPLLVIPRIGIPDPRKVAIFGERTRVVLSDCLFALQGTRDALDKSRRDILAGWSDFETCYSGSCAPYTTLRRLEQALLGVGVSARLEPRLARSC